MLTAITKILAAATTHDLVKDTVATASVPSVLGLAWLAKLTSAEVALILGTLNFFTVLVFRIIELRRRTKQEEIIDRLKQRVSHYEDVL